jgi:outer membrane protein assembly factor BamB
MAGSWPWFRGEKLDAICHDGTRLARQWPKGGPKRLWSVELGEGYAGAAVQGGCVYVLDYDMKRHADTLRCLSLDDGREIWRNGYPMVIKRFHGISRTVPAVVDKFVITFGPKCQVACWDSETGASLWLTDLVLEHGATVPQWYAGQCPLVDNDRLIVAPGGSALLMAVDYRTGKAIWKSPNPRRWTMTHVSIVPMELAGRRTYVYCGKGGVAGVSADDGAILWDTTDWKIGMATVPSPVILPEGKIFLCGGYNAGSMILQVSGDGGRFAAKTIRRFKPKEFDSIQQTPVLRDGHLYGVRGSDKQLVCLDLEGTEVWRSGPQHRFGLGPYMIADGLIYVVDDLGVLTLAEATPNGYRQLAQAKVLDGHDAWGPMAMVAGRLILRDLTRMVCVDIR